MILKQINTIFGCCIVESSFVSVDLVGWTLVVSVVCLTLVASVVCWTLVGSVAGGVGVCAVGSGITWSIVKSLKFFVGVDGWAVSLDS